MGTSSRETTVTTISIEDDPEKSLESLRTERAYEDDKGLSGPIRSATSDVPQGSLETIAYPEGGHRAWSVALGAQVSYSSISGQGRRLTFAVCRI
jgi:hypothetical protein